ncbi:uncharacterized protein [Onthophagus taurus]|uniref:uncharacterized protein isoform X2 n=1 Tax=Onthophagus taurus TaxID=166361 RepID=UPI000C2071D2|nr:uncharacterized protein LOC111428360 isoform X2 [Onthophagus taurus]
MSSLHFFFLTFCFAAFFAKSSFGQSNYADQANSIEYSNSGLPEYATLDGKVTQLDELSPIIALNRTKAALNCADGTMQIQLKFDEAFHGLAYADFDRNSACHVFGQGEKSYLLELPLKGCGTKQNPQRVFTNNIVVRFHKALEMDGDEIITIVCRYPPPVAPAPPVANPIVEQPPVLAAIEPPLGGFQILLIICAILFLSLLLLGLGCSYYCLRRRNMTVIRRHPFSSIGTESEITKISGSSLGNLSLFEGVKIPRAHAPVVTTITSSGSEGPLISDTLPSDYPSESHSEPDDERSLAASSSASYENKVFVHDEPTIFEPPPPPPKMEPKFDVEVKVKQRPSPPLSLKLSDDTESMFSEKNLSVIMEEKEDIPRETRKHHVQLAPSLLKIKRKQLEETPRKKLEEFENLESLESQHEELVEEPILIVHKPEITSHVVDDVFLRTITEKKTFEDVERHKRLVTEYLTKPKAVEDLNWDVRIKNYEIEQKQPPEWENFSDISSASGLTLTPKFERSPLSLANISTIYDNKLPLNSPELVGNLTHQDQRIIKEEFYSTKKEEEVLKILRTYDIPLNNPEVPNWDVLIRIFGIHHTEESLDTFEIDDDLNEMDKFKWKQIITNESTLKTQLTQAVIREDYEKIRYNYPKVYEPHKWDVIIRVLTPPQQPPRKSKRSETIRRKSLPTLYENESETTSEPGRSLIPTTISIHKPDMDLRSMSETIVDFVHHPDNQSEVSSSYFHTSRFYEEDRHSLPRSLSQPSLARSASEFTERWIAPSRYDTASEFTTPEGTPKSQRSSKSSKIEAMRMGRGVSGSGVVPRREIIAEKEFRSEIKSKIAFKGGNKDWFNDNDSDND